MGAEFEVPSRTPINSSQLKATPAQAMRNTRRVTMGTSV